MISGCPWPSDTVKSPGSPSMSWKSCAKIEIPHLENHILKVFRFRSWKSRVWKSRPQSWDPKSWKPYPKISRSVNSRFPKTKDPTSWKSCPKNFQVWVLETHTMYVPKLKIMSLKIPCLGFGEPPQVQANSRWPKTETIKNSTRNGQWLEESSRHCPHRHTDTVALTYKTSVNLVHNAPVELPPPGPSHCPLRFFKLWVNMAISIFFKWL